MECKVKGHSWLFPTYRFYSVPYQSGPIVARGSSSYVTELREDPLNALLSQMGSKQINLVMSHGSTLRLSWKLLSVHFLQRS